MRFKIYLTIEGNNFNPTLFNNMLDELITGEVIQRKRVGSHALNENTNLTYWRSKSYEVTASNYPEDTLFNLITLLANNAQDFLAKESVKISANIVEYLKHTDSPRGFFFSSELIKVLAQLNAEIDTDIVYDLQR